MLHRFSASELWLALVLAAAGPLMAARAINLGHPTQAHLSGRHAVPMTPHSPPGIVTVPSHHSVDQTVDKLEELLRPKGVRVFAVIDHSGEAEKVGLHMRPTKLVIFGNPKAGTPLMLASPSIAIDLPLKILVWEDSGGKVWVSYNSPAYLQARHALPQDLIKNIAVIEPLAAAAAAGKPE